MGLRHKRAPILAIVSLLAVALLAFFVRYARGLPNINLTEFDKSEQARANFEAGLRLYGEYYSAGQIIGSTLIALASGILVASIAIVERILPLSKSSNDWAVYLSWNLLGATAFLGFAFLWIAGRSLRRYADYLVKRGEAFMPGGGADEAKMSDAETAFGEAKCLATLREVTLFMGLLSLLAALGLLSGYVIAGPA